MMLHRAQAGYLAAQGSGSKYIKFADPAVEAVLTAKGVSSDGIGITVADAEAVTSIGTWFKGNTEITSFDEFEKFTGVTSVSPLLDNGQYAFQGCTNLSSIKLPEKLATIGIAAFDGCVSLSDIDLTNVKIIKAAAFRNSGIKLLNCPNLEGTIEWATFKGSSLENIMSLGNITSLDSISNNGAFMECSLLRQAILPNTLKIIAHASFAQCASLGYIEMQSNVEEIGSYAFNGIKSGATIICKATTPPLLAEGNYGFDSASIYVPDASVDAYKAATNWAQYASQIKPLSEYNG